MLKGLGFVAKGSGFTVMVWGVGPLFRQELWEVYRGFRKWGTLILT